MSKVIVICPMCHLRFYVPVEICHYDRIYCHTEGGHSVAFKINEACSDRKTNFTIEDAIKNIEDKMRNQ